MPATLVVQHNSLDLELLSDLIRHYKSGHRVFVASSAVEALAILETERIDLLVTDVTLPDMDGIDLLTLAGEQVPRPGAIVVTESTKDRSDAAQIAGASGYFNKPLDADRFFQEFEISLLRSSTRPLVGVNVPSLLQMLDGQGIHGVLTIVSADRKGRYYFQDRCLIHAVTPSSEGVAAAVEMINWEVHLFKIAYLRSQARVTFNQTAVELLLKAALTSDEQTSPPT